MELKEFFSSLGRLDMARFPQHPILTECSANDRFFPHEWRGDLPEFFGKKNHQSYQCYFAIELRSADTIKLRSASRTHFYSPMVFFILISTCAERQTCYQYTSKLPGKQKSCIYCTSRLTASMKRLRIQRRNRDFSRKFGLQ